MSKTRRIVGLGLAVTLSLVVLSYLGLRIYLNSDSVKQLASAKLTEKLGGDVRVTDLTSDLNSTTLQIEIPGAASDPPLIKGTVHVDVSPIGLASGRTPQTIQIDKATVYLHLDEQGNFLGNHPKPPSHSGAGSLLPEITISGATIHIVQTGKPNFNVSNVNVKIVESDVEIFISGTVDDKEFGKWNIIGVWDATGKVGSVQVETLGTVALTPQKLKSIPFVPAETWDNVELEGNTTARVKVGRGIDSKWTWHVECEPSQTRLKIFPIDLEVIETVGKVIVDGPKVTLVGVRGRTADGAVDADAVLDFETKPTRLEFKVRASNLDVKKTPKSWGLAARVDEGRMNGQGDITLLVADGQVRPEGKGKAIIKGKLFGGEADIELFLSGDGKRLQFDDAPKKMSHSHRKRDEIIVAKLFLSMLLQTVPEPLKKESEAQYVRANLKLRDVDIAELVAKANLASPVKLAGKVTLELSAEIPTNDTGSLKLYRAQGKLSTPSLQIEDLILTQVAADVELRDGILKLTRFSAEFPKGSAMKTGRFSGTASFGIDPRTELIADLTLDAIPLGQVFAALPGFKDKANGVLSGEFHLKIPGDQFNDLKRYEANAKLMSTGIMVFGQKADRLSVQLVVKNSMAELTEANADVYSGKISGVAKLPLIGVVPGSFTINFKDLDSAALTSAIPDSPVKLSGKFAGTLTGTLPPLEIFEASKITGDLALNSSKLIVQGIPTTKLTGKLGYKPGAITYDLKGDALGGAFDVDGTYPIRNQVAPKVAPGKLDGGTIRLDRIRLDRISRDLRIESLKPLSGLLSLTLKYTHGPDGPIGNGRVEIRDFGWGDELFDTSDINSEIRLDSNGIEIPSLTGELAGGSLRGRLRYDFDQPRKSFLNLKLENANASTLLTPLGLNAESGKISVSLRSSIGKEFRGGGTLMAVRAKIDGVDVSELRVPLSWQIVPGGRARLTIRDATGTVANGRVTARSEIILNGTARVEGRVEFVDVNVGNLAKSFGSSAYGVGKTTGRFDFTGDDVRSASDLKGDLTARFGQTTVKELPILGSISTLLSPVQALTRFDSGELSARLGTGLLRIERLSLGGSSAKLFADGTISLLGKLDLDVVYNSGQIGPSAPLLRLILRDIPAIGPIPVGLIVRITEGLSNRVVRLHIEGTTDRPSVRVNAANLLSENAVRFFVGQYVPLSTSRK